MFGILSIILFFILLPYWVYLRTRKPKNFPPGPMRLPIVGGVPCMRGHDKVKSLIKGITEQVRRISTQLTGNTIGLRPDCPLPDPGITTRHSYGGFGSNSRNPIDVK